MTPDPEDKRLSILLVEDNPAIAEVLETMLCTYGGYWAQHVDTAEDALGRLQNERPSLVMIDIGLPGRNGIWLAEQIHRHWPSQPMLILTGYAFLAYKKQAFAAGVRAFVLKDDVPGILEGIRAALAGRTYTSPGLSGDQLPPEYPDFPRLSP